MTHGRMSLADMRRAVEAGNTVSYRPPGGGPARLITRAQDLPTAAEDADTPEGKRAARDALREQLAATQAEVDALDREIADMERAAKAGKAPAATLPAATADVPPPTPAKPPAPQPHNPPAPAPKPPAGGPKK